MEYKRIEELTTVITGGTPSTAKAEFWEGGDIPWLQSGCCQNCDVTEAEKFITQAGYDNSSAKLMPPDTVMIALTGATAGKIGYLKFEACGNQSITGILPCDTLNQRFLFYYLLSQREKILADCIGGAQPHISQGYVKRMIVPVCSANEQDRIVENLSKLTMVIKARQSQLDLLDGLIKARFVEMFGDPVANDHGWGNTTMKSVCSKITDGEHGSVPRVDTGHPFLNAKHIKQDGTIDWSTITYTSEDVHQKIYKRCNPEPGDILMTTTGTIGNVAIVPDTEAFSMDRGITLLKINPENVNAQFIAWLLRFDSMQEIMQANVHASAIGHLFLNKVEQLPVIVPSIDLQKQFECFVAQVDKSKTVVQKSLDESQILFDSLMQEYFG